MTQDHGHNSDPKDRGADSADLDPTLESDVNEALADVVDAEVAGNEAEDADSLAAQLAERTEDLQRLSAEYANYRRRSDRERQANIINAKASVLTQLLPLLDDLQLAEQHGDLEGPLKSFRDKLVKTFDSFKVTGFGEEGEEFDPQKHEAVQDLSTGDSDEKVIGTVLRRGYELEDRLLRTAMVIIGDGTDEESEN